MAFLLAWLFLRDEERIQEWLEDRLANPHEAAHLAVARWLGVETIRVNRYTVEIVEASVLSAIAIGLAPFLVGIFVSVLVLLLWVVLFHDNLLMSLAIVPVIEFFASPWICCCIDDIEQAFNLFLLVIGAKDIDEVMESNHALRSMRNEKDNC